MELTPFEDEPLLIRRDSILLKDLGLYAGYRIRLLDKEL